MKGPRPVFGSLCVGSDMRKARPLVRPLLRNRVLLRFFGGTGEGYFEGVRRLLIHGTGHVGIDVRGGFYFLVPQSFLDRLHGNALVGVC